MSINWPAHNIEISGGRPAEGEVTPGGAKNVAPMVELLPIMTDETCRLGNVPNVGDAASIINFMRTFGVDFEPDQNGVLEINASESSLPEFDTVARFAAQDLNTLHAAGPLLHRFGRAFYVFPGGEIIGNRNFDAYLKMFERFGVDITSWDNGFELTAKDGLHGTDFILSEPFVSVTRSAIKTATLARGRTTIQGAANIPEVREMVDVLIQMGADITQEDTSEGSEGTTTFVVNGVEALSGYEHDLSSDRTEIGQWAITALATGGKILVRNSNLENQTFLNEFKNSGGGYEPLPEGVKFYRKKDWVEPTVVEADWYPKFDTDLIPAFIAMLGLANGVSNVHDKRFENRLLILRQLRRSGLETTFLTNCGDVSCRFFSKNFEHAAKIIGNKNMEGLDVTAFDPRGGFAFVALASAIKAKSIIRNVPVISNFTENLPGKLTDLGIDWRPLE